MKAEMRPGYRGEWAGDLYPLPFVVISPQHAIAPAGRAIASGGGLRRPCKAPADRAAKTRIFDHSGASITLDISFGISPTGHRRCMRCWCSCLDGRLVAVRRKPVEPWLDKPCVRPLSLRAPLVVPRGRAHRSRDRRRWQPARREIAIGERLELPRPDTNRRAS